MGDLAEKPKREYRYSAVYVKAKPGLRLRDRRVVRLSAKVRAALPWVEQSDAPTVRAWCEIEILCQQAYAVLRAGGILNEDGSPRRMLDDYRKLRSAQMILSRELGMTPLARQTLQANSANVPLDLVAQLAQASTETTPAEAVESESDPGNR